MPFFRRRSSDTEATSSPSQDMEGLPNGLQDCLLETNARREIELELADARRRIAMLEAELDRAERQAKDAGRSATERILEDLTERMATPVSHLAFQIGIIRSGQSELTVADVAAAAEQTLRAIAQAGITLEGQTGEIVAFDPRIHLALGVEPSDWAKAVLRSPAVYAPSGRLVRKATVEIA